MQVNLYVVPQLKWSAERTISPIAEGKPNSLCMQLNLFAVPDRITRRKDHSTNNKRQAKQPLHTIKPICGPRSNNRRKDHSTNSTMQAKQPLHTIKPICGPRSNNRRKDHSTNSKMQAKQPLHTIEPICGPRSDNPPKASCHK